jgi:Glycosyltransferase family 87
MPLLASPSKLPGWLWVLAILGFCFALFSGLQMSKNQHGVDDFNQFYVGARLVFTRHLYDLPSQLALQRATVGVERPEVASSRLPFYYVLLWPLARLPYAAARTLWLGMMILAAVLVPVVYPTRNQAALAVTVWTSLPLFAATIGQRQDLTLLLLILAIGLRLRAEERRFAAGLVLSLLAIKIHLFLLVPAVLVVRREWRMTGGILAGGLALVGTCFIAAGKDWMRQYLSWMSAPNAIAGTLGMPTLHGVLAGSSHAMISEILLSLAAVTVTLIAARRTKFELAFSAAMLGSFLLSRHAYLHDCAILIPALFEICLRARGALMRGMSIVMLTPFPYFLPALLLPLREGAFPIAMIAATSVGLALSGLRKKLPMRADSGGAYKLGGPLQEPAHGCKVDLVDP